ncbi:rad16 [Candida pseudojiufengensis]|uniref:rad16 n=1 Tax=Candida pseudojiufengensis TaxID=497109 RepID=UPI00222441CA|nr:rad16 [Candida pseudojiufengensis]KAI5965181.1 rad16 [Candida pseudojiufengensis]
MSLFVEDDDDVTEQQQQLLEQQDFDQRAERLNPLQSHISQTSTRTNSITKDPEDQPQYPVVYDEDESVPIYPEREVNSTLNLRFQQEIMEEMLSKDSLLILGRGLGWETITANLLFSLSAPFIQLNKRQNTKSLILLLNAKDHEIIRLKEEIDDLNWLNDETNQCKFTSIAGDATSTKRRNIYADGGIISISPRVLIVDILSGTINVNEITGLFILHADRIRETSNDAFIINVYRDQNEWGFIKALSDEPESFRGFTPLQTRLKILRLSNVTLWPRFHVTVTQSILYHKKKDSRLLVTEINTKLSYKMNKIQAALLSCIQACLGELKRHNPTLATEYWDMENIHDPDFIGIIRNSLDSQWHRLTFTTKQLLNDIDLLINLLTDLVTLDSVSFYQIVKNILDTNLKQQIVGLNRSMSPWLNLDESHTVIGYAKERALGQSNGEYLLEELPKWSQLGQLIDDIYHEKSMSNYDQDSGRILIMCSSRKIANQLNRLLSSMKEVKRGDYKFFSFRSYMIDKLKDYLHFKEVSKLVKKISTDLDKEEEEGNETKNNEESEINISKTFSRNGQPISKRRRTRGASVAARVNQLHSIGGDSNEESTEKEDDLINQMIADEELENQQILQDNGIIEQTYPEDFEVIEAFDTNTLDFEWINPNDQILIQVYNDKQDTSFLDELSPSHIILYEPNLSFIRRIELYQSINFENPAKLYFMYYGNSVEEQKHLLRIKKEKESFTKLIKEKANLGKTFRTSDDNYKFQLQKNQVVNTRIAGGANFRTENDEMRVIVDVREFGSSLPNLLYRIGISVIPCMITVGDYILSPKICIERKSIPDLIQSFKSGRLYNQCEQMFRHYELPTLLIEFDENKSFSLEPFSESKFLKAKNNANNNSSSNHSIESKLKQSVQSQIFALLYSFPKLKIIWSSSPYETAQIFLELKSNQEEPNVGTALDKGVNKSLQTQTKDGGPPIFNDNPIDFIQNIPGINNINYYLIIQKIKNIEEFVKLSEDELKQLIGNENGRKVYNFLNRTLS